MLLEHLTLTRLPHPEPSAPAQRRQWWEGAPTPPARPEHQVFPPRGKAVSNHKIQEMMNHSHRLLEITDLRTETSRNSSSPSLQDVCSPGSPGPQLAPAFSSAALQGSCGPPLARPQGCVPSTLPLDGPPCPVGSHPNSTGDPTSHVRIQQTLRRSSVPAAVLGARILQDSGVFNALALLERVLLQWGRRKGKYRSPQT